MKKCILVVEDNEKNRKLLSAILQSAGYEIIEAEDGEMGIEMAREKKPILIFMDIQMPGMDGIEATKILKSDPSTSKIPIIAITAYAMKEEKEKIISESGCDDYISKPIEIRPFLEKVKKYI